MREVLSQINAVPGVVGTLLCDANGGVLADAFPPRFDAEVPRRAARVLSDGAAGLSTVTGALGTIDVRYGDARIVVKPVGDARLLVLCSPAMNMQPLAMSTAVALTKLEKLLAPAGAASTPAPAASPADDELDFGEVAASLEADEALPADDVAAELQEAATPAQEPVVDAVAEPVAATAAPTPPSAPGPLYEALLRVNAVIEKKKLDPFRTRGAIALKAGFGLAVIGPDTQDHDGMLARLQAAAKAVLKESI